MNTRILPALIALLPTVALAQPTWTVDQGHSQVGFRVRHMMVSNTTGYFRQFSGTVAYDDAHPEQAQIDITIDTASIDSNLPKRDEHLRGEDFLDVAKYPTLTFKSKKVLPRGKGRLSVVGDLTIRGVTREVTLDVSDVGKAATDPWGNIRRGAVATTKINRKDFGLTWNMALEAGGVAVGDEVAINLEIELIQQKKDKA